MQTRILALLFLALAACASPSAPVEPVVSLKGVAPRYEARFQAVKNALDDRDLDTAQAVLKQLTGQLEREARGGSTRVREQARAAQVLASGFQGVIDGRTRLAALDMRLELENQASGQLRLFLVVQSAWQNDLLLAPGPASLFELRTQVDPAGRQASVARSDALDALRLEVAAESSVRIALGTYSSTTSGASIAERLVLRLDLRSGEIREGGEAYPAQLFAIPPLEYVGLASFLPTSSIEPQELAHYLGRPEPSLAPIMERAVRILPGQREEALTMLLPLLDRATDAEFQRMSPALNWLAPDGPPVAGRETWARWIRGGADS